MSDHPALTNGQLDFPPLSYGSSTARFEDPGAQVGQGQIGAGRPVEPVDSGDCTGRTANPGDFWNTPDGQGGSGAGGQFGPRAIVRPGPAVG